MYSLSSFKEKKKEKLFILLYTLNVLIKTTFRRFSYMSLLTWCNRNTKSYKSNKSIYETKSAIVRKGGHHFPCNELLGDVC